MGSTLTIIPRNGEQPVKINSPENTTYWSIRINRLLKGQVASVSVTLRRENTLTITPAGQAPIALNHPRGEGHYWAERICRLIGSGDVALSEPNEADEKKYFGRVIT